MKKIFTILSAGTLALVLAACNETATPKKDTTNESKLTLEQVYEKAVERQSEIKSLSADTEQKIVIGVDEATTGMEIDANLKMDMISEPLAMKVTGEMETTDPTTNEEIGMPIEMYLNQDQGFFMKDANAGWMKLPKDSFDEIMAKSVSSADAKKQLQQLQQFVDDFKFEQTDEAYILTLNAKGDKFKDLMESQLEETLPDTLKSGEIPLDAMTIEKANYVLSIDKKTFDTNKIDLDLDFIISVEGEEASFNSKSIITYTNVNKVNEIKIPQEIIDNAIEAEL